MEQKNPLSAELKREVMPDGSPYYYGTLNNEVTAVMDRIHDGGAALMSNYLKMSKLDSTIRRVSRDGCIITIMFHKIDLDDQQRDIAYNAIKDITDIAIKYYSGGNDDGLIPIYTAGYYDIPDSFTEVLTDAAMYYDRKQCSYSVMLKPQYYELLKNQKRYVRHILSDIMKVKKISFYDGGTSIIAIDRNEGIGPSADRAAAICSGVAFTLFGIHNVMLAMKEYTGK